MASSTNAAAGLCSAEDRRSSSKNPGPEGPGFFRLPTVAVIVAIGVLIPILLILLSFLQPEPEIWQHIVDTLLAELFQNTLVLCLGVLVGTFLIGTGSAWLTAVYEFPGRGLFAWALMLPLAVPTYVLAFVFIGLLDFSGPVQALLRDIFGPGNYWFPEIRSTGGVILVLSLALYPYVYLLAGSAFQTQGRRALEAAQSLGQSPAKAFVRLALPMARPWIAGGLMLVLMETLADFGAVSIFNYDTFTTGIYKAWFGFFSIPAAAQLSSILLIFVLAVILIEKQMRARMRYQTVGRVFPQTSRLPLRGWKKWTATACLSVVLLSAFLIPCLQLSAWAIEAVSIELDSRYIGYLFRSVLFSTLSGMIILGLSLVLAYVQRRESGRLMPWLIRLATVGYALPGTVLAVGVVLMVGGLDQLLSKLLQHTFGMQPVSFFNGSLVVIFYAYAVRFLTAGFNSIETAMNRITRSVDEAAILLGASGMKLLRRVHVPMLRSGIVTAAILVFVDVMKEMPITLMTRPFGWDTLAVKIFELTSEGEWQRAALPSIILVVTGLLPLLLLHRKSDTIINKGEDRP